MKLKAFNKILPILRFMMGVGASFVYLPSTTVCAFYFKERQALATGLAYAGAGIGFTFIPMAYTYIIGKFC